MTIQFILQERNKPDSAIDQWPSSTFVPQVGTLVHSSVGMDFEVSSVRHFGPEVVQVFVKEPTQLFPVPY